MGQCSLVLSGTRYQKQGGRVHFIKGIALAFLLKIYEARALRGALLEGVFVGSNCGVRVCGVGKEALGSAGPGTDQVSRDEC